MTPRDEIFRKLTLSAQQRDAGVGTGNGQLPFVPPPPDLAAGFEHRARAADSIVQLWSNATEALEALAAVLQEHGAGSVIVSSTAAFDGPELAGELRRRHPGRTVEDVASVLARCSTRDARRDVFAAAGIYIGAGLAGFADTGAVLIRTSALEGRSPSLLADTHLCILRAGEIYPHLAAFPGWNDLRGASDTIIIGGPSKTADIEKVLVRGVHGPRSFIIALWSGQDWEEGTHGFGAAPGTREPSAR